MSQDVKDVLLGAATRLFNFVRKGSVAKPTIDIIVRSRYTPYSIPYNPLW